MADYNTIIHGSYKFAEYSYIDMYYHNIMIAFCPQRGIILSGFIAYFQMSNQHQQIQFDYLFKIVIIGDSGVGKTNLLSKYVNNTFSTNSRTTIGVQLSTKILEIQGKYIQNQIWDTAGQQRFRAMTPAYYRNTVGALMVFDLTKMKSFENLEIWLKEARSYSDADIAIVLVGNKLDLVNNREVKAEMIQKFVERERLSYVEASACDGGNVAVAFQSLIKEIFYRKVRKELEHSEGKNQQIYRLSTDSSVKQEQKKMQPRKLKKGDMSKKSGCC